MEWEFDVVDDAIVLLASSTEHGISHLLMNNSRETNHPSFNAYNQKSTANERTHAKQWILKIHYKSHLLSVDVFGEIFGKQTPFWFSTYMNVRFLSNCWNNGTAHRSVKFIANKSTVSNIWSICSAIVLSISYVKSGFFQWNAIHIGGLFLL